MQDEELDRRLNIVAKALVKSAKRGLSVDAKVMALNDAILSIAAETGIDQERLSEYIKERQAVRLEEGLIELEKIDPEIAALLDERKIEGLDEAPGENSN